MIDVPRARADADLRDQLRAGDRQERDHPRREHSGRPAEQGSAAGDVHGFDVRTGKRLWTFHAIPRRGEFGHETWENESAAYTGGTNVWSLMSADEELGYVYLPFGTPTNDYYGGHRLGQQPVRGEPGLPRRDDRQARLALSGRASRAVGLRLSRRADPDRHHRRRAGGSRPSRSPASRVSCTCFDRRTGAPVWPIEERPVPQSTVPGERTVADAAVPDQAAGLRAAGLHRRRCDRLHAGDQERALEIARRYQLGPLFTPPSEQGTIVLPGHGGGANYGGASFDPDTGDALRAVGDDSDSVSRSVPGDPARGNLAYRHAPTLGAADGRWPAARQAAVRAHHRVRSEQRRHRVAGAARRRAAQSSAVEGPEARTAWFRRQGASVADKDAVVRELEPAGGPRRRNARTRQATGRCRRSRRSRRSSAPSTRRPASRSGNSSCPSSPPRRR